MDRLIKTILIISIAIFGAGVLFVDSAQAQPPDNLVVQFEQTPLFNEANFLPGTGVTRFVKVTNNSGSSQRIATEAINKSDPDNLAEKLNLVIKEGATVIFNDTLKKFFDQGETYLSSLANNANTQYDFTVSFNSGADDFYQGKTLGFDIVVGFEGTEGGLPLPSPGRGTGGGGGGGWLPPGLTIQNGTVPTVTETSVTINWLTSYAATSQVIYAKDGESHTLCLTQTEGCALGTPPPPKYGYAHTTPEFDTSTKAMNHLVTISDLDPNTTYYYRTVSHGSLAISEEQSFTTLTPGGEVAGAVAKREGKTGGLAQGGGIIGGESTGTGSETGGGGTPSPSPTGLAAGANILSAFGGIFSLWWVWLILIIIALLILIRYLIGRKARRGNDRYGGEQ